jgi:hypothetical protein
MFGFLPFNTPPSHERCLRLFCLNLDVSRLQPALQNWVKEHPLACCSYSSVNSLLPFNTFVANLPYRVGQKNIHCGLTNQCETLNLHVACVFLTPIKHLIVNHLTF